MAIAYQSKYRRVEALNFSEPSSLTQNKKPRSMSADAAAVKANLLPTERVPQIELCCSRCKATFVRTPFYLSHSMDHFELGADGVLRPVCGVCSSRDAADAASDDSGAAQERHFMRYKQWRTTLSVVRNAALMSGLSQVDDAAQIEREIERALPQLIDLDHPHAGRTPKYADRTYTMVAH